MRYRFLWAEAEDFMPFKSVRFDLAKLPGLVMVAGDRGPDRSNGAGKSALLEMLAYAWYGRTVRKMAAGKEIRRGAKACVVRSGLRREDGLEVVVERGRGPSGPFCRVSGLDARALASGAQAAIDGLIGDFDLFTSTAMFTGEAASFCRKTDAGRKELLEQMLGIHGYEEASKRAKDGKDAAEVEVARAEGELTSLQGRCELLVEQRAQLAANALAKRARLVARHREAVAEAVEAADHADRAAAAVAEWTRQAAAKEAVARKAREAAQERQEAAQERIDALTAERAECSSKQAVALAREREVRRQVEQLKSGGHPDVCPTCGQRWEQEADPDEVAKVLKRLDGDILAARRESEPYRARVAEIDAELEDARRERGLAVAAERAAVSDLNSAALRELLADAAEAEAELRRKQEAVILAAEAVPEDPEPDEGLSALDRELSALRRQESEVMERAEEARELAGRLDFWRKGFSRAGLPSYLVDSSVPGMNAVVAEVAAALTDGELMVRFDAAAAKGSQSVLAVEVDYAAGGEGFEAASRGERTRVDVAVLFALRDVASRAGASECEQLFLDEVMDGADPHFSQAFIRMLRKRYRDRQVVLISHDPTVVSLVDRVVTVRKNGDVAVLS